MELEFHDSIDIAADPKTIYDLVSDVTRTGEWSPICRECWWHPGDGPRVGAQFTGRNVLPERSWETVSTVTAAEPGVAFSWKVGEGYVQWGYRLEPGDGVTTLTENWVFTAKGQQLFHERFGAEAPAVIEKATKAAHTGIPATLAAIKRIIENGNS